ncbi:hypothetical protein KI387_020848, partial [Taxus chinensis]
MSAAIILFNVVFAMPMLWKGLKLFQLHLTKNNAQVDLSENRRSANKLESKNVVMGNMISTVTGDKIENMHKECRQPRNRVQEMAWEEVKENLLFDKFADKLEQMNQCDSNYI